jgi:TonB family protein
MMKYFIPFLLLLALPLQAQVEGDFKIYLGAFEMETASKVIVSLPEDQLMPAPGLAAAEEIKKTFQLREMTLVSNPKIVVDVGEANAGQITIGSENAGMGHFDSPLSNISLGLAVVSVDDKSVHVKIDFSSNSMENSGAEFFAPFEQPVTLASRLNHHMLFIISTFRPYQKEKIVKPRTLVKIAPEYPKHLKSEGIQGSVVLQLLIDRKGRLKDVHVVKSAHPDLEKAAIATVRKWKWQPGTIDGRPREMERIIKIKFTLQ